jgi:hypothetical protein
MRQKLATALARHANKALTSEVGRAVLAETFPEVAAAVPPWEVWSPEGLSELLCADADAIAFVMDIAACSHAYDDLIDGDKTPSHETIHRTMWDMLIGMPGNPFFAKYQDQIRTILTVSILNWRAANDMEASGSEEELRISHALRYALSDVLLLCMALVGGSVHAAKNARRARLMGQNDTWAHYRAEHLGESHAA